MSRAVNLPALLLGADRRMRRMVMYWFGALWLYVASCRRARPGGERMRHLVSTCRRAERRAAPKPARIPSGDRPAYSTHEGLS